MPPLTRTPTIGNLRSEAAGLAEPWRSVRLEKVGNAQLKLLRMDAMPLPFERHATFDEILIVLDGILRLNLEGVSHELSASEFCYVPAGCLHGVDPGSCGTLLIIDSPVQIL